jgi:outer membrane protein assembly factor BamD (BamD/ComL family)
MSQIEPTDLLCRSRREELSVEEQRRLNECLEHSLEVKLMSEMLSALESESRVRPGDDALLARITARALGKPERVARKRRPLTMLLAAAAVLLMASLASAWYVSARKVQGPEDATTFFRGWPWKAAKRAGAKRVLPVTKPMPSQAAQIAPDPEDAAGAHRAPGSEASPAASASASRRATDEPKSLTPSSASELFARANLLRRQGQSVEAAALYQRLLALYPNSREVAPTRLSLAKYFQAKQPEQALLQYRKVAKSGGPLRAEALWGISEVATSLGESSLAEQALADLIREFPDSPYAEVARTRTTHGLP